MLLRHLLLLLTPAFLALACAHSLPPAPPKAPAAAAASASDYRTIRPDVSLSRNAQDADLKQASVDPNEDVMAEILAIPPGR